jgi:hypothetical protein
MDEVVQRARGLQVVPERLLDDQSRPAVGRSPLAEPTHDRRDDARRDRQVVDAVSVQAALPVGLLERRGDLVALVGEVRRHVAHPLRQRVPDLGLELVTTVPLDRVPHPLLERLVRLLGACDAEHGEAVGKQLAERERVQGREELLLRQVAGGAEDDERTRIGRSPQVQPLEERVRLRRRDGHRGSGEAFACSTARTA